MRNRKAGFKIQVSRVYLLHAESHPAYPTSSPTKQLLPVEEIPRVSQPAVTATDGVESEACCHRAKKKESYDDNSDSDAITVDRSNVLRLTSSLFDRAVKRQSRLYT